MGTEIAAVGCGYWGKNIVRTLSALGVLGAVVDDNAGVATAMAEEHGSKAATLEQVLADPSISGVAIATPAATHYSVAQRCLEAGKDTFVEKPMALQQEHARKTIELAEANDRILMVGHLLQYHPVFESLMRLVKGGELGRLRYVYSNRLNFGKIRREEDVMWSFAPHDISMLLKVAGEEPDDISTVGTFALHERIADTTTTHLKFPSGLRGHIFVSWLHPIKEQKLVVIGDDGMAVFDDRAPWEEKLAKYSGSVDWVEGVPVARPSDAEYVEVPESEPLASEMSHFVDCIESRRRPRTDGHEGMAVLRVLNIATDDLARSKPVLEEKNSKLPPGVHPTAVVDEDVSIGSGVKIWHFSHILGGSTIGDNCSLGQNVVLGPNVSIGSGCRVQNNVSIYDGVTLEEDVFCGPSMVFTNIGTPRAFVERKHEFEQTLVKKGASIGANATVVCGNTIGGYALIAAGAVVTSDVPAHALMLGVPAKQAGWVSHQGEVLGSDLRCPRSGDLYEENDGRLQLKGAD